MTIGLMTTNYGHDGYPWKEHNETNLPVKKSSDLDAWVKKYSQKIFFWIWEKILSFQLPKSVQKSTLEPQNQNSDTTFISSTFKVEEIKVVSELWFSHWKMDFWPIFGILNFFILLYLNEGTSTKITNQITKTKTFS